MFNVHVDARVSAMFTSAITDLLDDCSDWPIIIIATTTSRSSLSISLHDLFVHCIDFDVCLPACLCLYLCVCLCLYCLSVSLCLCVSLTSFTISR